MLTYKYIEEKAEELLKSNNLFKAGFDINKLALKLKIKLVAADLSDDVSGFFVINKGIPTITYKKEHIKSKRTRFTIAHEIGHYILHSKEQPIFIDKTLKILYRNSASSTGEILKEREANTFAAALLMPKQLVDTEINNLLNKEIDNTIKILAEKFDVSEQALSFRLSNLGYDIG
jgi:Zn-dependent peptidase ImmA (M78 family)